MTLACPIEILGYPIFGWGGEKYFKIKLVLHQDPSDPVQYVGSLQGMPQLFTELDNVLESKGRQELLTVRCVTLRFFLLPVLMSVTHIVMCRALASQPLHFRVIHSLL